ncbi:hypothetical protein Tco_0886164 [Tanacetum coccineum]
MLLYIKGKEHGKQLYDSVINGPFQYEIVEVPSTITSPQIVRDGTYEDLTKAKKICRACDIRATNIVLQGLPPNVYSLVNHHTIVNEIWERVKLLIEGSELSLQERESKLYDEFDTFTSEKGEIIHSYYLRFAQLINNMNMIGMSMQPLKVNTKFVNHLQPEWSKFVTNVKLAKDMHNTNFDHLYAYLRQHEARANEVCLMRQQFLDPLALVANTYNSPTCYTNQSQYHQQLSPIAQQYYSPLTQQQSYQALLAY